MLLALIASALAAQEPPFLAELESFRSQNELPAVAAAIFTSDEVLKSSVTGVRSAGKDARVTEDDLWHIGSLTKSFTSALLARYVEAGKLSYDQTLAELLPDLVSADSPYRPVTVRQLLSHKAGLAANPSMSDMSTIRLSEKSLPEQRRAAVTAILAMKPTSEPDTAFLYSNAGFITAGAIVESIGGDSWEALLRREVLEPLGLESAGFGAPGEAGENDQPRGHTYGESTGRHFPAEPPLADNPAFLGPAGTLHLSLSDLVTWGQVHMRGERGEIAVPSVPEWLSTQTFRTLHRERGDRYALGWVDEAADPDRQGLSRTIWHNGSNTFWYALLLFQPELDRGVVMITNAGIHAAALVDREARRLLEEHAPSGSGEGR